MHCNIPARPGAEDDSTRSSSDTRFPIGLAGWGRPVPCGWTGRRGQRETASQPIPIGDESQLQETREFFYTTALELAGSTWCATVRAHYQRRQCARRQLTWASWFGLRLWRSLLGLLGASVAEAVMVNVPNFKLRMTRVSGHLHAESRGCHLFRATLLLVVLMLVVGAKVPHRATAVAVPYPPVSTDSEAHRGSVIRPRYFGSMERPGLGAPHRGTPQNVGYVETNVAERKQLAQSKLVVKELKARTFSVATYQSLGMILVTELGDKTFFIAAVLAARNSRFTVLQGALSALLIMTVLSALLGRTFPKLFSPKYTSILAGVLFLYFGVQMIRDYWRLCQKRNRAHEQADGEPMNGAETHSEGNVSCENEWQVLEEKLARERDRPVRVSGDEAGMVPETDSRTSNASTGANATWLDHIRERMQALETLAQVCFSPLFLRAFTLTFLAEWGDRSQIATIALAAHRNLHGVVLGATFGHLLCTGLAVIGGRLVAHKIPERFIALCGGVLFILFGVLSFCTDHADS